jgi:hypothetical protein
VEGQMQSVGVLAFVAIFQVGLNWMFFVSLLLFEYFYSAYPRITFVWVLSALYSHLHVCNLVGLWRYQNRHTRHRTLVDLT